MGAVFKAFLMSSTHQNQEYQTGLKNTVKNAKTTVITSYSIHYTKLYEIGLSGVDLVLLQKLAEKAKLSLSTFDDRLFVTELSIALYLLPAVFAGIGVNLVSHVLIRHLNRAEKRFEQDEYERHRYDKHSIR